MFDRNEVYDENLPAIRTLVKDVEIHGVRDEVDEDGWNIYTEQDDSDPEYFSVYIHYDAEKYKVCHGEEFGGLECIADFFTLAEAREYAESLKQKYGWEIIEPWS